MQGKGVFELDDTFVSTSQGVATRSHQESRKSQMETDTEFFSNLFADLHALDDVDVSKTIGQLSTALDTSIFGEDHSSREEGIALDASIEDGSFIGTPLELEQQVRIELSPFVGGDLMSEQSDDVISSRELSRTSCDDAALLAPVDPTIPSVIVPVVPAPLVSGRDAFERSASFAPFIDIVLESSGLSDDTTLAGRDLTLCDPQEYVGVGVGVGSMVERKKMVIEKEKEKKRLCGTETENVIIEKRDSICGRDVFVDDITSDLSVCFPLSPFGCSMTPQTTNKDTTAAFSSSSSLSQPTIQSNPHQPHQQPMSLLPSSSLPKNNNNDDNNDDNNNNNGTTKSVVASKGLTVDGRPRKRAPKRVTPDHEKTDKWLRRRKQNTLRAREYRRRHKKKKIRKVRETKLDKLNRENEELRALVRELRECAQELRIIALSRFASAPKTHHTPQIIAAAQRLRNISHRIDNKN